MDLLHLATQRLRFVQNLYELVVLPLEETKRQIRVHNSEGDPEFLSDWEDADGAVIVVGYWCLCMVQATLQAYLRNCVAPMGSLHWNSSEAKRRLSLKKGGNWFESYRLFFLEDLGVDWKRAPISIADLEQLNLTRNDIIHEVDMMDFSVKRPKRHVERFPIGLFTEELWQDSGIELGRIDKDKLEVAIRLVAEFCTWLDGIRCGYPRYMKSIEHEAGGA